MQSTPLGAISVLMLNAELFGALFDRFVSARMRGKPRGPNLQPPTGTGPGGMQHCHCWRRTSELPAPLMSRKGFESLTHPFERRPNLSESVRFGPPCSSLLTSLSRRLIYSALR